MNTKDKSLLLKILDIINLLMVVIFLVMGVLNLVLVHPIPGIFYLLLTLVYLPQTNLFLKLKFGFSIPRPIKTILGLMIIWGSLAVGDLAEILGL